MAIDGTAAYDDVEELPPLVRQAVEVAILEGFTNSCLPSHGRLLQLVAGGVGEGGVIGETGTGCGVGLAWLASGARSGVRLVSVERDARLGLDTLRLAILRQLQAAGPPTESTGTQTTHDAPGRGSGCGTADGARSYLRLREVIRT